MIVVKCESCHREFEAQRTTAKWCSLKCKKRGVLPKVGPAGSGFFWVDGRFAPVEATEVQIRALTELEVLGVEHEGLLATVRGLAKAVEVDPFSVGLWREFKDSLAKLEGLFPVTSAFDAIVASLRGDSPPIYQTEEHDD